MTRIRATCPACGEVDLRPHQIELRVVRDVFDEVTEGSRYSFDCPTCADVVVKPADERVARLLTTGGVTPLDEQDADEQQALVPHPESPPVGPRLTLDDLISLHELLESDAWFTRLEAMTR